MWRMESSRDRFFFPFLLYPVWCLSKSKSNTPSSRLLCLIWVTNLTNLKMRSRLVGCGNCDFFRKFWLSIIIYIVCTIEEYKQNRLTFEKQQFCQIVIVAYYFMTFFCYECKCGLLLYYLFIVIVTQDRCTTFFLWLIVIFVCDIE